MAGGMELTIMLCLSVTGSFRLAAGSNRHSLAVAAFTLTSLTAAIVCLRPSVVDRSLRVQLEQRHAAGTVVGSLCLPTLAACLLASGHPAAGGAFWISTAVSLVFLFAQLFGVAATDLHQLAPFRFVKAAQGVLCMSVGELCLVAQGLLCLMYVAARKAPLGWGAVPLPVPDDDAAQVQVVVEVLMVGCLLAVAALLPVLATAARPNFGRQPAVVREPSPAAATTAVLLGVIVGVETPWLWAALGQNPFTWVAGFLASGIRVACCGWWVVCLLAISVWPPDKDSSALPNIVVRKYFHFLAVAMFVPVLMVDAPMLSLAFAVAVKVMVYLEVLRCMRLPPLGPPLHAYMARYLDARDGGYVILTHMYLIIGCAVTTWLPSAPAYGVLLPATGALVLGVGDAAAATVGRLYGRFKWSGSPKTVEGTSAAVASMLIAAWAMRLIPDGEVARFVVATVVVSFLETVTKVCDNLVLPLLYYTTLLILAAPE